MAPPREPIWVRPLPARWRRYRARRPDTVDLGLVVVAACVVWPLVDWWLRPSAVALPFAFYDWEVYAQAIDHWQAGEPLYTRDGTLGYHRGYLYPPLVLLLLAPFVVLFDPGTGAMAWAVTSLLLLWIGLQLLIRELGYGLHRWERVVLLVALVGFQPLLLTFKMGQLSGFLVGLLCLAYVASEREGEGKREGEGERNGKGEWISERTRGAIGSRNGPVLGGVLTGLVGFVKLSYAPVGTHLLVERRRLAGAIATVSALVAASVAIFGLETHLVYLDVLEWGIRFGNDARPPEIARPTYFMPLNWLPGSLPTRILASLLVAGTVVRSRDRSREAFALGLAAFPLLVPTGYSYYLVAIVPAGLVMLAVELERDGHTALPVLAIGLANAQVHGVRFLVGWLPDYLTILQLVEPLYPLFQPGLWGTLVLVGLAFHRVAETAEVPNVGRRGHTTDQR